MKLDSKDWLYQDDEVLSEHIEEIQFEIDTGFDEDSNMKELDEEMKFILLMEPELRKFNQISPIKEPQLRKISV